MDFQPEHVPDIEDAGRRATRRYLAGRVGHALVFGAAAGAVVVPSFILAGELILDRHANVVETYELGAPVGALFGLSAAELMRKIESHRLRRGDLSPGHQEEYYDEDDETD